MISMLKSRFCFAGLYAKVKKFVISCEACQKSKHSTPLQPHLRTLYEVTTQPFERVHIDFIGEFDRSSRGNRWICNITDSYSSYIVVFPLRTITVNSLAHALQDKFFNIYGHPKQVVSDRGSQFTSEVYHVFMTMYNIKVSLCSAYHPQANGLVERANQSVTQCLRALVHDNRYQWCSALQSCAFALNNTVCSTSSLTPYNLIFGRDGCNTLDTMFDLSELRTRSDILADIINRQEAARQIAIDLHEKRDREWQKNVEDKPPTKTIVCAGSIVYWKVPKVDSAKLGSKLSHKYRGPYMVTEVHKGANVNLRHLASNKIHNSRVSISQLKVPAYVRSAEGDVIENITSKETNKRLTNKGAKFSTCLPGDAEE